MIIEVNRKIVYLYCKFYTQQIEYYYFNVVIFTSIVNYRPIFLTTLTTDNEHISLIDKFYVDLGEHLFMIFKNH